MATSTSKYAACMLVKDRTLKLKSEADSEPFYNGIVVTEDTLLVIDFMACNLHLYRRHDGKLYKSHRLKSRPTDVCLISKTEAAVCLLNSTILILSFKSVGDIKLVKTLYVITGFTRCYLVAKLKSDKLVFSGMKWEDDDAMLYWSVVNLTDGRVDSTNNICKGSYGWSRSHLAINYNTVYISCWTYDSITTGVYAYDISNPHKHTFLYQHHEWTPGSVMADKKNFIFVSDLNHNRIHQLTDSGQLVTIHTVSSRLYGIFSDDQHGVLYTTSYWNNVITLYKLEYSHQTEMKIEWNFTINEIQDAWESLEVYLSDELYPNCLLISFENERLFTAQECEDMRKLRRRQVVNELLQRIKAKLPESFLSFLHALNKTKQQVIMQGLRQHIKGIDVPQPSTHGQETSAVAYYTLNMQLLKDRNILHETESKTRAYMDKGCIVFDFEMRSQCFKWESGSVIVYLRPLGKLTKERLDLFCQHGGMKNFLLDLLKKKDIFPSLPGGEISIHIQVCSYDKDTGSEDADEVGDTQMTHSVIRDTLRVTDSFIVTDKTEVIKQNIINQYEYMIEEIEPLSFKDTFVSREILDMMFFEKLKMRRRKERATDFLNEVLVKGNAALEALVHDLRDSGIDDLVRRLCIAPEKDEGQVDDGLIEVVREDSASPVSMVFIVRKNEDADRTSDVMGSNGVRGPVTPETPTQSEQKRDSVDEIASAVTDQTIHDECQEPLQKRALPPGKKYHAFFSYSCSDIQWVKQTVGRLEKDYGFVCCEYDRDNTPGTPLLTFAEHSIRNAYKTVIVMTSDAFKSGFVLLEVDMAIRQGLDESRKCVVPVLLKDCEVPLSLRILNYVDVRDTKKINIWFPKLVMELET